MNNNTYSERRGQQNSTRSSVVSYPMGVLRDIINSSFHGNNNGRIFTNHFNWKMYVILINLFWMFFFSYQETIAQPSFQELQNQSKESILVVSFLTIGECVKCQMLLNQSYRWLSSSPKFKSKIVLVAMIHCNREIEIHQFKKENTLFDFVYPDFGQIRRQLNISKDIRIAVFSNNKLLGTINEQEYFGDIQSAFKRILKIK